MGDQIAKYSVYITHKKKRYRLTNAMLDIELQESEATLAQRVGISLKQTEVENRWLTDIIDIRDRIYVYAKIGNESAKKVFIGYVWEIKYEKDADGREIKLLCYDNLIYWQESEEFRFFKGGRTTKSIADEICKAKGIPLKYSHKSIKHEKIVVRGTLADVFIDDLLEPVRKKTGKRGVIRYTDGEIEIFTEGTKSETVYRFMHHRKGKSDGNIITTTHNLTMDGVTTKVIITGNQNDSGKTPTLATVKGNTKEYGTIQKIISKSDNEKLSEMKKEAQQYIKDHGQPEYEINIVAIDNPYVRKGDKIYFDDGYRRGYATVKNVVHSGQGGTIEMDIRYGKRN